MLFYYLSVFWFNSALVFGCKSFTVRCTLLHSREETIHLKILKLGLHIVSIAFRAVEAKVVKLVFLEGS